MSHRLAGSYLITLLHSSGMDTRPETNAGFIPIGPAPIALPTCPIWIGWSLIAGLAVAIPCGLLLAYLAALPFMLGLFFFLVLGLITGATMFRFASRAALPSVPALWVIGSTVATSMMVVSLWAEFRALPGSVQKVVRKSYYESFTDQRHLELSTKVGEHVSSYLATHYPPGGLVGYMRWAIHDGQLQCPRFVRPAGAPRELSYKPANVEYRLPYKRWPWLFRVCVCVFLLHWTILSQLIALKAARTKAADQDSAADGPEGT